MIFICQSLYNNRFTAPSVSMVTIQRVKFEDFSDIESGVNENKVNLAYKMLHHLSVRLQMEVKRSKK